MRAYRERNLDEAVSEVEREINVRARCFDRWIADGKLSCIDAEDRRDRLVSALEYLKRSQALQEATAEMTEDSAEKAEKVVKAFRPPAPATPF